MEPISPVVEGLQPYEVVWKSDDPNTGDLPALRGRGPTYTVVSRWKLTPIERQMLIEGGDVYLLQQTFGNKYQPTSVQIFDPITEAARNEEIISNLGLDSELNERLRYPE